MIVIPMAGLSSRFFNAGYSVPKYMLLANGFYLFDHSMLSFKSYFGTMPFLFIVRDIFDTAKFVSDRCVALGIVDYKVVVIDHETRGQAETVFLGLTGLFDDEPITIFNIDTQRLNFSFPPVADECSGYLEVFKGEGDNWSYVLPDSSVHGRVCRTAEKNRISNLCSTGLYHFRRVGDFITAFNIESAKPKSELYNNELYIAPMYNNLINLGLTVAFNEIEINEVTFFGTPSEYQEFCISK